MVPEDLGAEVGLFGIDTSQPSAAHDQPPAPAPN